MGISIWWGEPNGLAGKRGPQSNNPSAKTAEGASFLSEVDGMGTFPAREMPESALPPKSCQAPLTPQFPLTLSFR